MVKAVIFDMYETLITLCGQKIYMGHEISEDCGIDEPKFREIWDTSDEARATGQRTFEDVIEEILRVNNCYDSKLMEKVVAKRRESKEESFNCLHEEIIPMMKKLKEAGIKIGLITNCFNEERDVIVKSELFTYFDGVCMSCVEGMVKPDERIFRLCLERLGLEPSDCLYCGDGGSLELEVAKRLGMKPVQALWYLKEGMGQPVGRLPEFDGAKRPLDIVKMAVEN